MDLKDDEKSRKCCEHPHNSRYYETNAGRLFVKNINPFDTVGGKAGDVRNNLPNKRKITEFINIYDKKPNKMPSKDLVNEMYTLSNNYKEHMSSRETHNLYHGGQNRPHAQSMMSMSADTFNTEYSFSSSDVYKPSRYDHQFVDSDQDNNRYGASSTKDEINDYVVTDGNEDAYCSSPNQDFVYKTMQRNARLQKIVRKLVIEREREKQREAWNNYINDLKNKHRYYSNEPSRIVPQYVPGDHNTPEMIDDFYNMRVHWRQSNPCQHLLEGIYAAHDDTPSTMNTRYPHNYDGSIPPDAASVADRSFIYDNDRCSYPCGSQGSMIRLNKERQCYALNLRPRPSGRHFHGNSVMVDNNREHGFDTVHSNARPYFPVPMNTRQPRAASASMVTANLPLVDEEDHKEVHASKAEIFQDGNNIYFPYCTDEIPPKEDTLEPDQYVLIPLKNKSFKRYMHASALLTQEHSKLDKDVNVPSYASLKCKMDFNSPNKLTNFKNKMVEKVCNVRSPLKTYEGNNLNSQKNENFNENFKKVSENINKLKAKIRQSEEDTKVKSLATIEEKIDCLMKSMNSIMSDIQEKRNTLLAKRSAAVSACKIITSKQIVLNRHSSDPYNYKSVDYTVQDSTRSLTISEMVPNELRRNTDSNISKMEKILIEEMEKSDKAKSDIEEILNRRSDGSCSLQITFDIPTKERSTEVTDSLSKARCKSDEKIFSGEIAPLGQRGMTIAVNTDPLGLFALLRVSTETVKQILSYVPTLNCQAYLSLLPLLLPVRRCVQHFTCNICGASFSQPSQLSAHVKQHNLGKTRDCCVCRHALDSKCARASLFRCRYCGQRFTRAYCCELHQKSCARQLGRAHDVTSSHVLLQ